MILQLLLIYFAGREFGRLAADFKKNIYLFWILGGGGIFLLPLFISVLMERYVNGSSIEFLNNVSPSYYGLISIGVSVVLIYFMYEHFEARWKKERKLNRLSK